jgi:hypothetical protein
MDAASLVLVRRTADDIPRLMLGGYAGQVFEFDASSGNDGLPTGTTKRGSVTGATSSTLTDSTAAFTTTGGKLIERYVTAIDPAGTRVQRRRITANTGTQLTVSPNWTTTPNTTWTYVVGGPDMQLDTRLEFSGMPFLKKRFRFLFLVGGSLNSGIQAVIHIFKNFNIAATAPDKVLTATLTGSGSLWDHAQWDSAVWGGIVPAEPNRLRVGMTGIGWRARIINRNPDEDVQIQMVGMESELLSDKLH